MLDALPQNPLFENLAPDQVTILKSLFEPVSYPPATVIIAKGDVALHLYLTLKGTAAIHYKPYDGPAMILAHLRAGDAFGWSAMMGSQFYTSTIISDTEVDAIRIKRSQILSLIQNDPNLGRIILDRLARSVSPRWHNAHEQAEVILNLR